VHVVLLLFDAARAHEQALMLSRRELALAGAALDEGKALLLVANKADLLQPEQLQELLDNVTSTLERMFMVAGRLPTVALSALQVRRRRGVRWGRLLRCWGGLWLLRCWRTGSARAALPAQPAAGPGSRPGSAPRPAPPRRAPGPSR
jgi:hypothetical protein